MLARNRAIRSRLAGLVALVLSLGGIAGCGDAGAADSDGNDLRVLVAPVFFEPAYIGRDQGFFAAEGLEVEIVPGGTAAQAIPQVVSGEVDIGATGGVSLIAAVQKGIPVEAVSGLQNATPAPVTSGLLVRPDSPIQDYGDLAGKVVALNALQETTHAATQLAVESAGADPGRVRFVQLPLPNLNEAVLSGQVDAAYSIGTYYPAGLGMGLRPLGAPAAQFLTGGPTALWFTTTSFVEGRRDVLERFNRAMARSISYAGEHPDVVRALQVEHTEQDPEFIRTAPIQPLTPTLDRAGIQATVDAMVRFVFLPAAPAYDDIVWSGAPQA